MSETIETRVIETLSDVLGTESEDISSSTQKADIEEWDSLSNIRLIVALESTFSITLDVPDLAEIESVGELVELIQNRA